MTDPGDCRPSAPCGQSDCAWCASGVPPSAGDRVVNADGSVAVTKTTLPEAHTRFQEWLGEDYDLDALDVTLAAAAVDQLDGDPLWVLLVGGSGNAKTETVQALSMTGAVITSTISSPGALLSGSPKRERGKASTGGLLRRIGPSGVLVIKDVTSILSMDRNTRGQVLAGLREVYDGFWERNVGADGGRSLAWHGRIVVIGAVTTAWDHAHSVVAKMGDRFVVLRLQSNTARVASGRRSIRNAGGERTMRDDLSAAAAGVLAGMNRAAITLSDGEVDDLVAVADLVTRARTAVETDYRGDPIDAHALEMPTRFAKELAQIVRGGVAIGLDRDSALHLALRCARDSMPTLRLAVLLDVADHPDTTGAEVRRRLGKPRSTTYRTLDALQLLGLLEASESDEGHRWRICDDVDNDVLTGFRPKPPDLSRKSE